MTNANDWHAPYRKKPKSRRVNIPSEEVDHYYRIHRKRRVRVEYIGPIKTTCIGCGIPFLFDSTDRGRHPEYHSNACKQRAYRERKKRAGNK
jgi:hypothetical protein